MSHVIKRNLIANYLGQGWFAIMNLAFIPLYIKYLGIEAYGLIGLFALLQAWLSLLDMGMTPALSREMARFSGGGRSVQSIRDLLRSVELIAVGIGLLIAGGMVLGAEWLAANWLQTEALPVEVVAQAFVVMGLVAALRFIESIYRSSIISLQRQVLFNIINSAMITLRGLGAVAILAWVSSTVEAFFLWQGLVSILTLGALATATYASLPRAEHVAHFSLNALRGLWRFAGGMFSITFLALLWIQVDKVLLSKLLSLSEFGYYMLAATVAGALYTLIGPIVQAVYPRMCEQHTRKDNAALIGLYHKSAQLVSVFAGSAAIVMILFAENFLRLWTQDQDLSMRTAPLLSLLTLGNLIGGLMSVPYHTQLAHGWTSLSIKVNFVAVVVIVPAILLVTPHYGAVGAAWCRVGLNLGFVLVAAGFMYRRILSTEKWRWYVKDLLAPLLSGVAVALLLKLIWPFTNTLISDLLLLCSAAIMTTGAALLAATRVRRQ